MSFVTITMPTGTSEALMAGLVHKISSWYVVHSVKREGLSVTWKQHSFHGSGPEGVAAFLEGVQLPYHGKPIDKQPIVKYDFTTSD